jgi:8-oxo-dGTP diphosphatase
VISIANPDGNPVAMKDCPGSRGVLSLRFHDVSDEASAEPDWVLFDYPHARAIYDFVSEYPEDMTVVVHCEAGLSRSAGVAAALSKFYNGNDKEFFERRRPNSRVYSKLLDYFMEDNSKQSTPEPSPNFSVPRVGVGTIIFRDSTRTHVLMGLRKSKLAEGHWAFPGGHMEWGESPEDTAVRETLEETGLVVKPLPDAREYGFTTTLYPAIGRHYVTLYIACEIESGELVNMEPEKCERWEWVDINNPPQPLMESLPKKLFGSAVKA